MFAPSLISFGLGSLSNPFIGATTTGGKLRSRQTIKVKSKSAEVTAGAPVIEMYNNKMMSTLRRFLLFGFIWLR